MEINGILITTITIGETPPIRLALIPEDRLEGIDLDAINGVIVNTNDGEIRSKRLRNKLCNQVEQLYWRLGLETLSEENYENIAYPKGKKRRIKPPYSADLKDCLDPKPPFSCKQAIVIGWTI